MKTQAALMGLFLFSGCATLSPAGEHVKIVDPAQLTELGTCMKLGKVTESSGYGRDQLLINLKNETAENGGNVVVSKLQTETYGSEDETRGVAFACPDTVLTKLHDAEDF